MDEEHHVAVVRERERVQSVVAAAARCRPGKLLARAAMRKGNREGPILISARFHSLKGSLRLMSVDPREGENVRRTPLELKDPREREAELKRRREEAREKRSEALRRQQAAATMAANLAAKTAAKKIKEGIREEKAAKAMKEKNESMPGRVIVHVQRAASLPRADRKSSDPLVELTCRASRQKFRTKAVKKSLNPVWNEKFVFGFPSLEAAKNANVKISVYDWDLVGSNDLMGTATLSRLAARGSGARELRLTNLTTGKDRELQEGKSFWT
jgi:hypothetical protein